MLCIALPVIAKTGIWVPAMRLRVFYALMHVTPLTYGPFLLGYTLLLVSENRRLGKKYLLHFIPALLVFLPLISGLRLHPPGALRHQIASPAGFDFVWLTVFIMANISLITYPLLVLVMLRRHRRNITDYFSNESSANNLRWLRIITIAFLAANISINSGLLLRQWFTFDFFNDGATIEAFGLFFFVHVFSLFAARQQKIFRSGSETTPTVVETARYERSGLRDDDAQSLLQRLNDYMEHDEPWLDCDLTIVDIANSLHVPRHHLTQVINSRLGLNFNNFVNGYRIRHVTRLIEQGADDVSMLRLAFEAGFNSKATFNRAFRDVTGTTPSSYKAEKNRSQISG